MKKIKFKILILHLVKLSTLHFALISSLFAGAPDTLWTRIYGGAYMEEGNSVKQTIDGGFVIAGSTTSFGAGDIDIYLIRTNSNGDTLWTKTYGGEDSDCGNSVLQASDSGFVIAGYTQSFGLGKKDFYLIRTNQKGDTLWTKTYGTINDDEAWSFQQTEDGGFIITGFTGSSAADSTDVYLVRTNSNGDTIWTKTYGGTRSDYGFAVQQTSDEGFIIAGATFSFGGDGGSVYLIRINSEGDTLWTKTHGGSGEDCVYEVQELYDRGFIMTGYTTSYGTGGADFYLIRTNLNGDTVWTKNYGGPDLDYGHSVKQVSDSGFIIVGSYSGAGGNDVYLIRTNSDGDTLWTKTYGGLSNDRGWSVQMTNDGGFIITGYTESFGAGLSDVYLIRLDKETVGIEDDYNNNKFKPNNFIVSSYQGNISIRYTLPFSTRIKLEAFNIQGRLVEVIEDRFMKKGSYSVKWDSKRLGAGVYIVRLSAGGSGVERRVTVLR